MFSFRSLCPSFALITNLRLGLPLWAQGRMALPLLETPSSSLFDTSLPDLSQLCLPSLSRSSFFSQKSIVLRPCSVFAGVTEAGTRSIALQRQLSDQLLLSNLWHVLLVVKVRVYPATFDSHVVRPASSYAEHPRRAITMTLNSAIDKLLRSDPLRARDKERFSKQSEVYFGKGPWRQTFRLTLDDLLSRPPHHGQLSILGLVQHLDSTFSPTFIEVL